MFAVQVIPDGPLHPEDAVIALIVGMVVGAVAGRRADIGPALTAAAGATLWWRHPELVPEGFVERPSPLLVLLGAAVAGSVIAVSSGWSASRSPRLNLAVAASACAGVWATAPDTEPALIGGSVLAGGWWWAAGSRRPVTLLVVVLPIGAAVVGTVGRPDRLPLVLAAAIGAAIVARLGAAIVERVRPRRQRAGTPTTVAPGATSAVTTAPAPTIAP
ncbi:MAG: hypothetical protein AAGA90_12465 [Actinomycetota bacterium]